MKKLFKVFGIIAISAIIVFSVTGCELEDVKTITITGLNNQMGSPSPNNKLIKAEIYNSSEYTSAIANSGDWADIVSPTVKMDLGSMDAGSYYVKLIIAESRSLIATQTEYFSTKKVNFDASNPSINFKDFGKFPVEAIDDDDVETDINDTFEVDGEQLYTFSGGTHTEVSGTSYNGTYNNWNGYYIPASGDQTISSWFAGDPEVKVADNKVTIDLGTPKLAFGNFLGKEGLNGIAVSEFNDGTNLIDFCKSGSNRIVFIWVDAEVTNLSYTKGKSKFDRLDLDEGWNPIELNIANKEFTYKNIDDISAYKWTAWKY